MTGGSNRSFDMKGKSSDLFPWILHDLERLDRALDRNGRSPRTRAAYLPWVRRYLLFRCRHFGELADARNRRPGELSAFLHHLTGELGLGESSRSQAAAALRFFHQAVLEQELDDRELEKGDRPNRRRQIVVPEAREVSRLFQHWPDGQPRLAAILIYGAGLRPGEAVRLRVGDLDFDRRLIRVRDAEGDVGRSTLMPLRIAGELEAQVEKVEKAHSEASRWGIGGVPLPPPIGHSRPEAAQELHWQWLFPIDRCFARGRHRRHLYTQSLQRAFEKARLAAGLDSDLGCVGLRHAFAVRLLQKGVETRVVQELLGHRSPRPMIKYKRWLEASAQPVASPLDDSQ